MKSSASAQNDTANIEQRIYDAMIMARAKLDLQGLCGLLPYFDEATVRSGVRRMLDKGQMRKEDGAGGCFELVPGATRPRDDRGWPKGKRRA